VRTAGRRQQNNAHSQTAGWLGFEAKARLVRCCTRPCVDARALPQAHRGRGDRGGMRPSTVAVPRVLVHFVARRSLVAKTRRAPTPARRGSRARTAAGAHLHELDVLRLRGREDGHLSVAHTPRARLAALQGTLPRNSCCCGRSRARPQAERGGALSHARRVRGAAGGCRVGCYPPRAACLAQLHSSSGLRSTQPQRAS
jgi:hypothetical protein